MHVRGPHLATLSKMQFTMPPPEHKIAMLKENNKDETNLKCTF